MMFLNLPPSEAGYLGMNDGAELYWERSGNPTGIPALWLHGGPGGSLGQNYRRYFDPEKYLIIGIDQRGSGRSRPRVAETADSLGSHNTNRLIADLESLREAFRIDRWVVSGVSWGTTLGLAYALDHPSRVVGLALMAVTTTSRAEVEWITEGIGRFFPEEWQAFERASDRHNGERLVDAYARRLRSGTAAERRLAAEAWNRWESVHVSLDSPQERGRVYMSQSDAMSFATLVTHYWSNAAFLPGDRSIINRVHHIGHVPAHLIHGRRDISGPAVTAWQLHQQWPASTLTVVEDEGHGGPIEVQCLTNALSHLTTFD